MDILPLMTELFEKMESKGQYLSLQKSQYEKLYSFVVSIIKDATQSLSSELTTARKSREPALIWAALKCCSHLAQSEECDKLLVWNYVLALDHRLSTAKGEITLLYSPFVRRAFVCFVLLALGTGVPCSKNLAQA